MTAGYHRGTDYHTKFHDLMSRIDKAGIDLMDLNQRKNFANSIVAVLPEFPGAWPKDNSKKKTQMERVSHSLYAAASGKQSTFNKTTEAAIRAGLAYHIARDEVQVEAIMSKPNNSKPKPTLPLVESGKPELAEQASVEFGSGEPKDNFNWTVRERLMFAFMAQDQDMFLKALKEVT